MSGPHLTLHVSGLPGPDSLDQPFKPLLSTQFINGAPYTPWKIQVQLGELWSWRKVLGSCPCILDPVLIDWFVWDPGWSSGVDCWRQVILRSGSVLAKFPVPFYTPSPTSLFSVKHNSHCSTFIKFLWVSCCLFYNKGRFVYFLFGFWTGFSDLALSRESQIMKFLHRSSNFSLMLGTHLKVLVTWGGNSAPPVVCCCYYTTGWLSAPSWAQTNPNPISFLTPKAVIYWLIIIPDTKCHCCSSLLCC